MAGDTVRRLVRFGVFELDPSTGELRKRGVRVALQEQPFQVLSLLVEREGDLVTREELRTRLWPDAVYVDFDHGLNKAVMKLRRALGDLAVSPRYIETLERRGYRFIAPTQREAPSAPRPLALAAGGPSIRLLFETRSVVVPAGEHIIGRDPGATVWIDSAIVSRQHALLHVDATGAMLTDLGSRNGTYLNGRRLDRPERLADRDEIRIGLARMLVCLSPPDATRSADTGGPDPAPQA